MNKLTVNFLQLLVVLLSISSFDTSSSDGHHGVQAAPLGSSSASSRRGSVIIDEATLDRRGRRKPRVGVKVSGKKTSPSSSNFPTIQSRDDLPATIKRSDGSVAKPLTVPLTKVAGSARTTTLHPQMQLQHHMNLANAKLDRMRQRGHVTKDDQMAALLRRRDSLQGTALEARRLKLPKGRQGIVKNAKTGYAGKSGGKDKRDETSPHNLLPMQNQQAGSASAESSAATTTASSASASSNKHGHQAAASPSKASSYNMAQGYPTAALSASNTDDLINATTPDTKGSLALDIEANDVGYVALFDVGTAGSFRLLVDSGSADTWVASTSCSNCSKNHKKLGKSTSTTYKASSPKKSFSITYGTGNVEGFLANDTLGIAQYTVKAHTFGLATKESDDFSDDSVPFDGLMGLAQQSLASSNAATPIDELYAQGDVPQPVMGYHLGRAADGTNSGEVTFGGVDAEKYTGDLVELPNVSEQGFWEATLQGVSFNGASIKLSSTASSKSKRATSGRSAILDTGTTLIVAPQADADALHTAIPGATSDGQGGYTIPCTTSGQVSLRFGDQDWAMDARDMIFLPVDENNLKGDCVSAISAGTVGQKGEWLVGAAFLKNVYFATNTKSNTLALGHLA